MKDVVEMEDSTFTQKKRKTFKVLLIGDGGVGKSTFLKVLDQNYLFEYFHKYNPTLGVNVVPLHLKNHFLGVEKDEPSSEILFNVWDCAGKNL